MRMRVAESQSGVPMGKGYAIMTFGSVHIPGDERSRTNPGHGYPSHNRAVCTCHFFDTEKKWREEIEKRTARNDKDFAAFKTERPTLRVKTIVEFRG